MPYESTLVLGFVILTLATAWTLFKAAQALFSEIDEPAKRVAISVPYFLAFVLLFLFTYYLGRFLLPLS